MVVYLARHATMRRAALRVYFDSGNQIGQLILQTVRNILIYTRKGQQLCNLQTPAQFILPLLANFHPHQ
jgi:hypothetical protein